MVLVALILLRSLFAFIDESSNIGKGDYLLTDALYFITLQEDFGLIPRICEVIEVFII